MGERIAPERRTRTDLIITAVIVVGVLAATVAIWLTSPARHSELTPASDAPQIVLPAEDVPTVLTPRWSAPSPATDTPAITRSSVVTGDGGTVTARALGSGTPNWTYRRDLPLCSALAAWPGGADQVLAVYRDDRGCSEVTALSGERGLRTAGRTSDADENVHLSYDTGYALSWGDGRLETWGDNLVRGIEYGRITAPVNPGKQPNRHDCVISSALSGFGRVAIVERCAGDSGYRLTVLGSSLDDDEKVRQWGSEMITRTAAGRAPTILAVGNDYISLYDGGTDATAIPEAEALRPRIRRFGTDAVQRARYDVDGDASAPAGSVPVNDQSVISYFTGKSTVVLTAHNGVPIFQVPGTIGAGAIMAGQLLLPVDGGISVRQTTDGKQIRFIPVTRPASSAPVMLRVLGEFVVEQRGDTVAVLS